MVQNKKLIFTALLAITCCRSEAFGMGRDVDGPSNRVSSRLGGGAGTSAQAQRASSDGIIRRADIIDFDTGESLLLSHIKLSENNWANEMQVTSATSGIQRYLDRFHIDASQVRRIPFSPQVLERPEFANYRELISRASRPRPITYDVSSSYSRSSSSTTTINGRVVGQRGRQTSTSGSKAKVIKCSDGNSVVSYEKSSETRGPGHNAQATGSSNKGVVQTEKLPQYLSTLGVQSSDVVWETSPQSSSLVMGTTDTQSFLRDFSALMGNARPSLTSPVARSVATKPVVRSALVRPKIAVPAVRNTLLRSNVAASAPKPHVGRCVEAKKPAVSAAHVTKAQIPPSRGVRARPVRVTNRRPQIITHRRAAPPSLVRPARTLERSQVSRPALRQVPARNTVVRPLLRTPAVRARPNNSRLPSRR